MVREIDEERGKYAGGESWPVVGVFVVVQIVINSPDTRRSSKVDFLRCLMLKWLMFDIQF
jgi:hypothetical protein